MVNLHLGKPIQNIRKH